MQLLFCYIGLAVLAIGILHAIFSDNKVVTWIIVLIWEIFALSGSLPILFHLH